MFFFFYKRRLNDILGKKSTLCYQLFIDKLKAIFTFLYIFLYLSFDILTFLVINELTCAKSALQVLISYTEVESHELKIFESVNSEQITE